MPERGWSSDFGTFSAYILWGYPLEIAEGAQYGCEPGKPTSCDPTTCQRRSRHSSNGDVSVESLVSSRLTAAVVMRQAPFSRSVYPRLVCLRRLRLPVCHSARAGRGSSYSHCCRGRRCQGGRACFASVTSRVISRGNETRGTASETAATPPSVTPAYPSATPNRRSASRPRSWRR